MDGAEDSHEADVDLVGVEGGLLCVLIQCPAQALPVSHIKWVEEPGEDGGVPPGDHLCLQGEGGGGPQQEEQEGAGEGHDGSGKQEFEVSFHLLLN